MRTIKTITKTVTVTDTTIKTVNKALEILEVLSEAYEPVDLAQLAPRVGLTRNKTFRILKTLCAKGLVDCDNGHYRLGFCSATLAQKLLKNMSVINYAHPVLEDLANKLDEAIYLTVPKDDEVLFLDMVDSCQQIRTESLLGRLLPFFTNAAGKVMKSLDSRDLIEKLLKKVGRKNGARELEKLDLELEDIRTSGVAIDRGGLGEGIISVAVAIRDYSGSVIGAIILIGPSFRIMSERIEKEIIPALKESAEILSGRFGYAPA
jgi:DNA-binding IclR family transcriptional regulator